MFQIILILKLMVSYFVLSEKSSGPLVITKSGKIRGHYLTSSKGNVYEAYQGIPYALPPIEEKRFEPPVPIEPWSNELQAIKLKNVCMHNYPVEQNKPVVGTEDCLYLNVYVPTKKKANMSLPVIFYIYGGAFRNGGAKVDDELYLMNYDVIFVSVNYRSGCLGFLSTDDEVVPGNMGLKDQSLALRWIYDNIEHFGGDQKKITLLGGSSGGVCVQYHFLSPWSRGLFHAGISMSGSAYTPAAMVERSRDRTIALGRFVNCTDNDIKLLVECLRDAPAETLVDVQNKLMAIPDFTHSFGPVVEKSGIYSFIDDFPSEIIKKGEAYDVPWVTGVVSEEGLAYTANYTRDNLKDMDEKWETLAPKILNYLNTLPKDQHAIAARKIRKHYFGEKPINIENLKILTKLLGDRTFSVGVLNAAKAQATANKSPVFFYYYDYRAVDSLSDGQVNSKEKLGVAHGDDVHLIVKDPRISPNKSSNDTAMQRHLIQMCTSVAYNGVPKMGVNWPRVAPINVTTPLDYLHFIGPDNLVAERDDNFAQNKFWNSIGFDEK